MSLLAELEIKIGRHDDKDYEIDLVFHRGDTDAETQLTRGRCHFHLDLETLVALSSDPEAYGRALSVAVFEDPKVRSGFAAGRAKASALDLRLNVRLRIEPEASELHGLHWETLHDPEEERALFSGERIFFSRYLTGFDWRPTQFKTERAVTAVAMIAAPYDVEDYGFCHINAASEKEQAEICLKGIPTRVLASGGSAGLENLLDQMREGCDILYLVCHGLLKDGEPWLWLENEKGGTARVSGRQLADRFADMHQLPRLVILISCQSGGNEEKGIDMLSALGPRLAQAGVPAVLAMQGRVSFETISLFLPLFFKELRREGLLSRAVAIARGRVRERPDWWMPILFTRFKSGRLWQPSKESKESVALPEVKSQPNTTTLAERPPIEALINPILGSVNHVFQSFLGMVPIRKDIKFQQISTALYDITAELSFKAETFEGNLFLCLPEKTALSLIESIFGTKATEVTDDNKDLIGEITNMIIGNAKADLPPSQYFKLSTPTIISGKEHLVSVFSRYTFLRVSFDSEAGPFDINMNVDSIKERMVKSATNSSYQIENFMFEPKMVDPLLKSAENIFTEFVGLKLKKKGVGMKKELAPKFELSALLNVFTDDVRGKIIINFSDRLALAAHEKLLDEKKDFIDDDVKDTVAELVNIITGNAKVTYSKMGLVYRLSIPYVIQGRNQIISSCSQESFVTSIYWTNMGYFEICLSFQKR